MKPKQMVPLPLCWLHVCLCILWKQKKYFSYLEIYCSMVISKQRWNINRQFFLFKNCSLPAFFFTWIMTTGKGFTAAWFVTRSRKYWVCLQGQCVHFKVRLSLFDSFICLFVSLKTTQVSDLWHGLTHAVDGANGNILHPGIHFALVKSLHATLVHLPFQF